MENSKECINQGRPVYFSYARNSSRKPEWEHISDCVDTLLNTMTANGLEYRVDVKDINMGDKISKFEEEIGWNSEVVVIIFSDKYFRSMHCMYEFVQIKKALAQYPEKRLMCIKSGDFNLADFNYIRDLERYWSNQKIEYDDIEFHRLRNHSGTEIAAHENGFYLEDIRNLYSFFSAINYSNANSINYDFFVDSIVKYYNTTPKPKLTPKPTVQQFAKTEQLTKNTTQPANKKLPIVPISIAAAVVVGLFIYFFFGNTMSAAQMEVILSKADSLSDEGDEKEAFEYYEMLAKQKNAVAQYKLGECYADGDGVPRDYVKAVYWYQKAADQDHTEAQFCLGRCYDYGDGVEENDEKALYWYLKAAEKGHVTSFNYIAYCYRWMDDYENSAYWFQKAAEYGDDDAQYQLGGYYYEGKGVGRNYEKAVYWYQKAAEEHNNQFAECELGNCYYNGEGVLRNYAKAVYWYQKSADQGWYRALYGLGRCYLYGDGVKKNIYKAKELLQKAADDGSSAAQELLDKL